MRPLGKAHLGSLGDRCRGSGASLAMFHVELGGGLRGESGKKPAAWLSSSVFLFQVEQERGEARLGTLEIPVAFSRSFC